ncbi:hypothetical protein C6P52_15180 [Enterococcus mundtii]|nr:hypothetical protein C6P52_15180 [Enterococcus mundtii]PTO41396.1 hypothetical protein C6P54_13470 [Enterococcus mundtii]
MGNSEKAIELIINNFTSSIPSECLKDLEKIPINQKRIRGKINLTSSITPQSILSLLVMLWFFIL